MWSSFFFFALSSEGTVAAAVGADAVVDDDDDDVDEVDECWLLLCTPNTTILSTCATLLANSV